MVETIATKNAPAAVGPYSQGKVCGNMVFVSGQTPINPAVGKVEADTIEGQAEQACKNVGAILEAAGSGFDKVAKTTCFQQILRQQSGPFLRGSERPAPGREMRNRSHCGEVRSRDSWLVTGCEKIFFSHPCFLYVHPGPSSGLNRLLSGKGGLQGWIVLIPPLQEGSGSSRQKFWRTEQEELFL